MNVLPIAQCLNSFIRHADVVKMANFTMLTSLLSSDPKKELLNRLCFIHLNCFPITALGTSVDTYVECDTFNTEQYKGIPYLDVTTVYSKETNTAYINVVNRHKDKAITADIIENAGDFSGKAEASVINSDDLKAPFTIDKQAQYIPVRKEVKVQETSCLLAFLRIHLHK